jgi:beta-mannanase
MMDGNDTYSYYYGDPAPNGQPWSDAPWGNTGNTWDRFEQNAGKKVSIDHYGQPNPWTQTTFYSGTANIITNRGAIPLMDMSSGTTTLGTITSGTYDSQIQTWAAQVASWGKPMFLRWDWEMNGTWYGYGQQAASNPAAFVAMWRHFHDVAVGQGATNISWVWCPNLEFSGSTSLAALYPGDAYVDWTCTDGYNRGAASTPFATLYGQTYQDLLLVAPSKPIMIGEVGAQEFAAGVKASWITDMLAKLPANFPRIRAVVWFNWRISENGTSWSWPIESSNSSTSAFAGGISSSYYLAKNYSSLPLHAKVPVP